MEKTICLINPGSASRKYAIYAGGQERLWFHAEATPEGYLATARVDGQRHEETWSKEQYNNALEGVLAMAEQHKIINSRTEDIVAIGVRVVAPGTFWQQHRWLDEVAYTRLLELRQMAPLHLKPLLQEYDKLRLVMPKVPVVAVSDSAWHATMPAVARHYGLPAKLVQSDDLYRFGYHGISGQSVIRRLPEVVGWLPARVIVCHLGSGTSVTAVLNGQSVDTSMGFSPLSGVITGTRASDLDAGVLLYLMRAYQSRADDLEKMLNHEGGLLAISGQTNDVRQLLQSSAANNTKAKLAIDLYVYQVRKQIGAYIAALGGLDLLVFTATIGERSAVIRSQVCRGLESIGLVIDAAANEKMSGSDGIISAKSSTAKMAVVKTDELAEVARIVGLFLHVLGADPAGSVFV